MNKENKEKMQMLNVKNYKFAKRFYRDLCAVAKDKIERQNVFSDFLSLVYDGQMKEREISETIPDYTEFFAETITNVKKRNKASAIFCRSKKALSITALIISSVLFIGVVINGLLSSGDGGFPSTPYLEFGHYLLSDDYVYMKSTAQINPCEIDFRFLNSNRNKVIFDDGICKIYINSVSFSRVTDTDGNLLDCYYEVSIVSEIKRKNDYARVVCGGIETLAISYTQIPVSNNPFSRISYQIGEDTIKQESVGIGTSIGTVYFIFTITGGENGENAQELYNMDKITLEFDNFFVNEWFRV